MFLVAGLIGKDVNVVKTCGLTDKQTNSYIDASIR